MSLTDDPATQGKQSNGGDLASGLVAAYVVLGTGLLEAEAVLVTIGTAVNAVDTTAAAAEGLRKH